MKAVILAAGRGLRMGELTNDRPKPMLSYRGKNLLEHKIDVLPPEVDEVIMVVGYLKEVIMDYFGDSFKGKKIRYIHMPELFGSGPALWLCKEYLFERFIVMMGDDIYTEEAVQNALNEKESWSLTAQRFEEAHRGGIKFDENNIFLEIDEGVAEKGPTYANTGLYVLTPEIFNFKLVKLSDKEEWGLQQTMVSAKNQFPIKILHTTNWKQITAPEDLV